MKIRHVQEQLPPNGLPPPGLFIAHFRDAASVMLRYLSTEQTPGQGQEVRKDGGRGVDVHRGVHIGVHIWKDMQHKAGTFRNTPDKAV